MIDGEYSFRYYMYVLGTVFYLTLLVLVSAYIHVKIKQTYIRTLATFNMIVHHEGNFE